KWFLLRVPALRVGPEGAARLEQILQRDAGQIASITVTSGQSPVSSLATGNRELETSFLSLTELEALACSLLSVLLPLLDACVARQEAGLLEPLSQLDVVLDQCARD